MSQKRADPQLQPSDIKPDQDVIHVIPDWVGERMALICREWVKAGYMFKVEGELLDRLTEEAKRRADSA